MENSSTHSDLELFTRTLNWDTRPTISKIYSPVFFGGVGFGVALLANFLQRRPVMSGMYATKVYSFNDRQLTVTVVP